jgi:hypothetical protein
VKSLKWSKVKIAAVKKCKNWYKNIILSVVLYGCETWSLTLMEEHKPRVFENRVLRRIFVSKTDEVMGGWRKLHNEDLRDLYTSPSIIKIIKSRRMRGAGHTARMVAKRNTNRSLVGKSEGKRPPGRPGRRCMDYIKNNLGEVGLGTVLSRKHVTSPLQSPTS